MRPSILWIRSSYANMNKALFYHNVLLSLFYGKWFRSYVSKRSECPPGLSTKVFRWSFCEVPNYSFGQIVRQSVTKKFFKKSIRTFYKRTKKFQKLTSKSNQKIWTKKIESSQFKINIYHYLVKLCYYKYLWK